MPWTCRSTSACLRPRGEWQSDVSRGRAPVPASSHPTRPCRYPHRKRDELTVVDGSVPRVKPLHMVVQRGPRFYKVDILADRKRALEPRAIERQLRAVLAHSAGVSYEAEPPVGALTAWHRDSWADARAQLATKPINAASLRDIDEALFVLTLDDAAPTSHEALSRAMLHGDTRNRWYDKCLNIIVCANGKAGINWEHAWGDGVAVLNFFNEVRGRPRRHWEPLRDAPHCIAMPPPPVSLQVYKAINALPAREMEAAAPATELRQLRFDVSDATVSTAIREAERYNDGVVGATELRVYQSPSLTKEDIKRSRLSPDGVMQM